jgi:stage II sporulation protein AA (anti-sigma F factor antagonist)
MRAERRNGCGSAAVTDLGTRDTGATRDIAEPGFSVSVRGHPGGRWTVLEVEGEMDLRAFPLIPDLVGTANPRVVLELHGVSFMDARGLGAIVECQRRALVAGGYTRLVAPSPSVRRVLALTGCDRIFLTFDTIDQAVSAPSDADPRPTA